MVKPAPKLAKLAKLAEMLANFQVESKILFVLIVLIKLIAFEFKYSFKPREIERRSF